jgi:hypothetical protein
MSSSSHTGRVWATRWWAVVMLVFAAQLTLIVWLGDERPAPGPPAGTGPVLTLAEGTSRDLLALADPTLFALPHREGFSGAAWLSTRAQEIRPFAWSEPPRFLELPLEQLAVRFPPPPTDYELEHSSSPADFTPELLLARVSEAQLFPTQSAVRRTGVLEARPLRNQLDLPPWSHTEILSNSVVQVLVDAEGTVFSALLLGPGCGYKEADDFAVRQAAVARFAPLLRDPDDTSPLSGLVWGELVFEWHTLRATNSPAQTR